MVGRVEALGIVEVLPTTLSVNPTEALYKFSDADDLE